MPGRRRVEVFFIDQKGCSNLPVWVFGEADGRDVGLVVDLSESGLQLMVRQGLAIPSGPFQLHLAPQDAIGFPGADLTVVSRWAEDSRHFDHQTVGCELVETDPAQQAALATLMAAVTQADNPHLHLRCEVG